MKNLIESLAVNYFNSSLSNINVDYFKNQSAEKKALQKKANTVFYYNEEEKLKQKELGFSRNILIIGAGASMNAHKGALTTDKIISEIYLELDIYTMLVGTRIKKGEIARVETQSIEDILRNNFSSKLIAKRFFLNAFSYIKEIENHSITLKDLLYKLKFEGALKILHDFINKEDISKKIVEILNYRYIPSLFYEIVAHLFKHRFIDVIIDLNFDEMLDNAIDDEMGDADWIRITDDASCVKFQRAIIDDRLRIPLYVKPHGTISNVNSLLYSVQQYINLSSSIKDLLIAIFDGENGSKNKIKRFNIMSIGYAFNDQDILGVLYRNINGNRDGNNDTITKLYIFNPSLDSVLEKIKVTFADFKKGVEKNNEKEQGQSKIDQFLGDADQYLEVLKHQKTEDIDALNKKLKKVKADFIHLVALSKEEGHKYNLNHVFLDLYLCVRDQFRRPFKPSMPYRHLFNCQILSKKYNERIQKIDSKNLMNIYRDKAYVNYLFDFLKFNGRIPRDVIVSDRIGKYTKLYLQAYKNEYRSNFQGQKPEAEYIFGYLKQMFEEAAKKRKIDLTICDNGDSVRLNCFYDLCYNEKKEISDETIEQNLKIIFDVVKKGIIAINPDFKNGELENKLSIDAKELASSQEIQGEPKRSQELLKHYIHRIPFTGSHEITAKYMDDHYLRFYPFESKNIINTNLSLTYHFFDFVYNKKDKWSELFICSQSGGPIINLHKECDIERKEEGKSYLEDISEGSNKINLYHCIKNPVYFLEGKGDIDSADKYAMYKRKPHNTIKAIKSVISKDAFEHNNIPKEKNIHKMALFKGKGTEEYIFGVYFLHQPSSNRINPIWFDKSEGGNNAKNLAILGQYLEETKANKS